MCLSIEYRDKTNDNEFPDIVVVVDCELFVVPVELEIVLLVAYFVLPPVSLSPSLAAALPRAA